MLTVGLDGLKRRSALCVLNRQGKQLPAESLPGGWPTLREVRESLNKPYQVAPKLLGEQGVAGSNPVAPILSGLQLLKIEQERRVRRK